MRLACAALLLLSACRLLRGPNEGPSLDPESPAARQAALSPGLTLGPGDLFEVRVFQEPDLSGVFRVGSDGTIDYPLCGRVKLLGLTAGGAVDVLTGCLKPRYLKDPHLSILVRESNSKKIFVFGEVQRPGTFPYEEGMSVVQAVTLAGGFTRLAAKNSCTVTRRIGGEERRIRVAVEDVGAGRAPNFGLLPGDILFVPESLF
jgi:polysaccharide export outer membrane protein